MAQVYGWSVQDNLAIFVINKVQGIPSQIMEETIPSKVVGKNQLKILVVEDELTLVETLTYNLERQGYAVYTSGNGRDALKIAQHEKPDLIILDVMLPGIDGFEVCRVLRKDTNAPILMLTAHSSEIDKIVGLEVGADDYLSKPFSMRELLARIKAHLRRVRLLREEIEAENKSGSSTNTSKANQFVFENLLIDLQRREVKLNNNSVPLKPMEFDLLHFLALNKGIVVSRDQILESVWGWDFNGGSRTVDVHMRWLREKIEPDSALPTRIITVRGVGYRFEG